jgi:hypothetical protein
MLLYPPYTCYMPRPFHSTWFDQLKNIWWGVRIIKLFVTYSSPLPYYIVPLRPKCHPQHTILKHPQPKFLPQCDRPSFTPIQITGKIIFLYTLIFIFLDSKLTDKDAAPNDSKHSPNLQKWHISIFYMKACVNHEVINPVKSSNCFMHHHFEHSKVLPYDHTGY